MRIAIVLAAASALLACEPRAHLVATHGRSYRAAFARQDAHPARRDQPAQALTGLDSQEASIIAETYRQGLVPKGREAEEAPMLLLTPQRGSQQRQLAPSVPR